MFLLRILQKYKKN